MYSKTAELIFHTARVIAVIASPVNSIINPTKIGDKVLQHKSIVLNIMFILAISSFVEDISTT